jgi:hypothetical protein
MMLDERRGPTSYQREIAAHVRERDGAEAIVIERDRTAHRSEMAPPAPVVIWLPTTGKR